MENRDEITQEELSTILPQLFSINLIAKEQFEKFLYKYRYESLKNKKEVAADEQV